MALQSSPASLESLPAEILQMILAQMNSPEDLYSATQASNRLSQAFLGHREPILITVIQSSLDPGIFECMLRVLRIPVYENLKYVPNAPRLETPGEPEMWDSSRWHARCRRREMRRLATDFVNNDMPRIHSDDLSRLWAKLWGGDIESFPVPCLSRVDNAEQWAQNKRMVNEIAELYDELRKDTKGRKSPLALLIAIRKKHCQRRYALFRLSDSLPARF